MAIDQPIVDPSTGVPTAYWRVIRFEVDAVTGHINFILGGYATKDLRQRGGRPNATRQYLIKPSGFAELAGKTVTQFLLDGGVDVGSWSASVLDQLSSVTLFDQIATPLYNFAATHPAVGRDDIEFQDSSYA